METDPIEIIFIPQIEYKTTYGQCLKIKGSIFKNMAAMIWQSGDKWTSAWTVSLAETKILEYQYIVSDYKEATIQRSDIVRTINLEALAIDRTKAKSSLCVLKIDDLWGYSEKSKLTFDQVPIKADKGCIVLGKYLNPDGSPFPELFARMEKLAKILKAQPDLYKIAILTGSKVKQNVNCEADVMYELGLKIGIDPNLMFREKEAKTTLENAIFAKILAANMGLVNLDIITSNYHLRRSEEIFKAVFGCSLFKMTMVDDEAIFPSDYTKKNEAKENYLFCRLKGLVEYGGFSN